MTAPVTAAPATVAPAMAAPITSACFARVVRLAACALALFGAGGALAQAETETGASTERLRIHGSTTVNPVATRAAERLRAERGLDIRIDTQGGSTGGISALGDGLAEIAMSSRSVSDRDREKYPRVEFVQHAIGADAVAMVVSKDVWDGGVRALSADQVRGLYEGRIRNWQQIGGPDSRVVFMNREPGRGEWEVFGKWLYGDPDAVPLVAHLEVGGNEEARTKVGSTRGAVTFLSSVWADGERVYGVALDLGEGEAVEASGANIASGRYPMSRPLFLVTRGAPSGAAAIFVETVLGPAGQALVAESGYLRLEDLGSGSE